jgi:hypothetical protein
MNQSFFNRLIHLMQERPLEGKRILGLPPAALWELWQRIAEQDEMALRSEQYETAIGCVCGLVRLRAQYV